MDPQKILEKARSKNMLTKPDSEYSQKGDPGADHASRIFHQYRGN